MDVSYVHYILFFSYINDLEWGLTHDIINFANDTKMERLISDYDAVDLQKESNDQYQACKYVMSFNVRKCTLLFQENYLLNNCTLHHIVLGHACKRD